MDREKQTFEEARAEGTQRLERFVRFVFGDEVEVVNAIDSPSPDIIPTETQNTAA